MYLHFCNDDLVLPLVLLLFSFVHFGFPLVENGLQIENFVHSTQLVSNIQCWPFINGNVHLTSEPYRSICPPKLATQVGNVVNSFNISQHLQVISWERLEPADQDKL